MVRGRRVRTVVSCNRIDECCSPNPKRRDPGLILNGKGIEQFFQVTGEMKGINLVTPESPLNKNGCEKSNSRRKGTPRKLNINDMNNFLNTGTPFHNQIKAVTKVLSPPTPHRIELRSDSEEVQNTTETPLPEVKPKIQTEKRVNHINGQAKADQNHKLTEYFPVRRSVRKTKKTVLEEKQRSLEHLLRQGIEEGLRVQTFEGKGRGVVASKPFEKGDFVVEYSGDLIDIVEAKKREQMYAQDHNTGCYMYYFKYKGQQYCIDATAESGRLGRLVNHSRNGNLITRTISVDNKPRLVLIAKTYIKEGEEVTYDYGDRSKESLQYHPWLAY